MLKTNISWNWEKSEKESKSLFPVLGVDMEEWEVNVWWNKLGFKSDFILRGCFYAFINLYNYWNLTIHRKFTHSVRESEVHQTLWSLDPKHSNREATGTDTKPSTRTQKHAVHRNTQRCRLSSGGHSAAKDASLDISCFDRFDHQTKCVLGKRIHMWTSTSGQALGEINLPHFILINILRVDGATDTNSFHSSTAHHYLGPPLHTHKQI